MDEDYFLLYEEILSLLIGAGYVRAQIRGLSPFDKILGGMTWCLQMMSQGVQEDIFEDLLFSEDVSIGAQVSLTEKVVRVLISFGCPHEIDPHQMITGEMDFPHLLPVIKWLVQRGDEARRKMIKGNRGIALKTFYEQYGFLYPNQLLRESKVVANRLLQEDVTDEGSMKPDGQLHAENEEIDKEISSLEEQLAVLKGQVNEAELGHRQRLSVLASIQAEEMGLRSESDGEPEVKVGKLSLMIEKSESLKRKEKEFKSKCAEIIEEMVSKNEGIRREISSIENSSTELGTTAAQAELNSLKSKLSALSLDLLTVEQRIDDVPSKFELSQYNKRFGELEEMYEAKEFESRKLNISYVALRELKVFIQNQIRSLDHLSECVPPPNSASSVSEFMCQIQSLSEELSLFNANIGKRIEYELERRSAASRNLDELTDKYRTYTLLTKDLQDILAKNEKSQKVL